MQAPAARMRERAVDEARALARHEAAALALAHARGAEPRGDGLQLRDERARSRAASALAGRLGPRDEQRRRRRARAPPARGCDRRRSRPLPPREKVGAHGAGAIARSSPPAAAASAAAAPIASPIASAVPSTRSAPIASWLAEAQRPATPSRPWRAATSAPRGTELGPLGCSKRARRWSRQSSIGQHESATSSSRRRPARTSSRVTTTSPTTRRVSRRPMRRGPGGDARARGTRRAPPRR